MNKTVKNEEIKSERPIGIFDSGIGGLTVVKEILKLLHAENIIYLGDTARVPYGIRTPETITRYAIENTEFLLQRNIKLLVVACNTVSATSLEVLKKRINIPVIGVLEPGVEAAIRETKNKRIGVIGTEATIKSSAYYRALTSVDPEVNVFCVPCPLFVPLVEEGWTDGEVVHTIASTYLKELRTKGIDTLVLGCTHYPLLKGVIKIVMDGIKLVDSAIETARITRDVLRSEGLLRMSSFSSDMKFYVTDGPERFKKIGERFLWQRILHVEQVEIL